MTTPRKKVLELSLGVASVHYAVVLSEAARDSSRAYVLWRRYAVVSDRVLADPILFGDFRNALVDPDTAPGGQTLRLYEDLGRYSDIQPLLQAALTSYNEKRKPMQLVFFDDALEHLTRIQRTLRLPRVRATASWRLSGLAPVNRAVPSQCDTPSTEHFQRSWVYTSSH